MPYIMPNTSSRYCVQSNIRSPLSRSEAIAWSVAFTIEALAVVIFNLVTIAIFATHKRLRERKFYLLFNLTVADFLVGATAIPYFVYILGETWGLWGSTWSGRNVMGVTHVDIFTGFLSIINLAMIAVERFYATFWPFRYLVLQKKVYFISIALIWFLSAMSPSVLAITSVDGLLSVKEQAYIWVPFTIILFIIMCVSYVSILVKVLGGKKPRVNRAVMERNRKLTMSLLVVTHVSLLTWMPYAILHALISLDVYYTCNVNIHYMLRLLHYANSLVNPIIYVMRIPNTSIKTAALDVIARNKRRTQPPLPSPAVCVDAGLPARQRGMTCTSTLPNPTSGVCTLLKYQVTAQTCPSLDTNYGSPCSLLPYFDREMKSRGEI